MCAAGETNFETVFNRISLAPHKRLRMQSRSGDARVRYALFGSYMLSAQVGSYVRLYFYVCTTL